MTKGIYEVGLVNSVNKELKKNSTGVLSLINIPCGVDISVGRYPMGQMMHTIHISFVHKLNLPLIELSFPVNSDARLTGDLVSDTEIILFNIEYQLGKFIKVFKEVELSDT